MVKVRRQGLIIILAVVAIFSVFDPGTAWSETRELIAEGEYIMNDFESPDIADGRALFRAKQAAVEAAGTYVESYAHTKNFQLEDDEVRIVASSIMQVNILERKQTTLDDGTRRYYVKIAAKINTDNVNAMRNRLADRNLAEAYKQLQAAYEKSMQEIASLKQQYRQDPSVREQVVAAVKTNERRLTGAEYLNQGWTYIIHDQYQQAVDFYTRALAETDDPELQYKAYDFRSIAYQSLKQYDQVLEDYAKMLELATSDEQRYTVYCNRARIYTYFAWNVKYQYTDQEHFDIDAVHTAERPFYTQAADDYTQAIGLAKTRKQLREAYESRGHSYYALQQREEMLADYAQVIVLAQTAPERYQAYKTRATAYESWTEFNEASYGYAAAIEDYRQMVSFAASDRERIEGYLKIGALCEKAGRYSDAVVAYKQVSQYGKPPDPDVLKALGRVASIEQFGK